MKTVMIVLLAVVAMACAQGVNVVDNNNPGHVNVVDNTNPGHVNVVDNNPLGGLILDRNPSQVHVVDYNPSHVNVVDNNPQGNGGFVVDQAFYRPVANPSGSGYQPISNGPALVNTPYQQQPGAYPQHLNKPGTHPGARGGR